MTVHLLDAERSGQSKKLHRSPRETARGHQSCEADAWIAAQAEVRRNLACTTTEARASRRDIRYRSYVRLWRPFRCGGSSVIGWDHSWDLDRLLLNSIGSSNCKEPSKASPRSWNSARRISGARRKTS